MPVLVSDGLLICDCSNPVIKIQLGGHVNTLDLWSRCRSIQSPPPVSVGKSIMCLWLA